MNNESDCISFEYQIVKRHIYDLGGGKLKKMDDIEIVMYTIEIIVSAYYLNAIFN